MANPVSATQQYQFLAKVPDQVGYLVIGEDGAVILVRICIIHFEKISIWKIYIFCSHPAIYKITIDLLD